MRKVILLAIFLIGFKDFRTIILTVLLFLIICLMLLLYDGIIFFSYPKLRNIFNYIGRRMIAKKNIFLSLFVIKLDYYWLRIGRALTLNIVSFGRFRESKISSMTVLSLSFGLSLYALEKFNTDLLFTKWENFSKIFKTVSEMKTNWGELFSMLSAVILVISVVLHFFFNSQKREVRRIVSEKEGEFFEIVVLKHRDMSRTISKLLPTLQENLEYIIRNQSLIVELMLNKQIKNYKFRTQDNFQTTKNFKEIEEITMLVCLLKELKREELYPYTLRFSRKRYNLLQLHFRWDSDKWSESSALNRSFFTKEGVEKRILSIDKVQENCSKEEQDEKETQYLDFLADDIYVALEMLYSLERYNSELTSYLRSSSVEKMLIKTLIRE